MIIVCRLLVYSCSPLLLLHLLLCIHVCCCSKLLVFVSSMVSTGLYSDSQSFLTQSDISE